MLSIYQERERKLSVGLKSSFGYDYDGSNVSMFQNEKEGEINMKEFEHIDCIIFCNNEEKARITSADNKRDKYLLKRTTDKLIEEYGGANMFMLIKDERDSFDGDFYGNPFVGFINGKHLNEQTKEHTGVSFVEFIDFLNGNMSYFHTIISHIENEEDLNTFIEEVKDMSLIVAAAGKLEFNERGLSNMKTRETMLEEMKKEINKNMEVIVAVNGKEKLRVTGDELESDIDFRNIALDGVTADDKVFVTIKDKRDSEGLFAKNEFIGLILGKHLAESCKKLYDITIDEFLDFMNCDGDVCEKIKNHLTNDESEKLEELFGELKRVINFCGKIKVSEYYNG